MPTLSDVKQFLGGQIFGQTSYPDVNLRGKTIIVTGANTGLGFECVKQLVALHASKIILACRDMTKGRAAVASIKESFPDSSTDLDVWPLDLAQSASTLAFANRVRTELSRLDGFVANAGVEVQDFQLAEDIELTLKVNVVSTFLLAIAVLPKLQETSATHQVDTNITIVGSLIHIFGPDTQLDVPDQMGQADIFDALSDPDTADMAQRYPLSKLMGHLCSRQLARRVRPSTPGSHQVVVNWVNPGWCQTELSRGKNKSVPEIVLMPVIGWTAAKGARSLVYGVTADRQSHGRYLAESQIKEESAFMRSKRAEAVGDRVWKDLMGRIQKVSPETATILNSV